MLDVVDTSELDWTPSANGKARGGNLEVRLIFRGEPKALDNYEFSLMKLVREGQSSPRHHHNFDQLRYGLKGPWNYGPDEPIPEGQLGYFPEGGYYGPFTVNVGSICLSLQLAGATGYGFMCYDDQRRGHAELTERGTFERGVYTYFDDQGKKHNQDAYEAIWEHVNKREIHYPKARLNRPVVFNPQAYTWMPVEGQPGVTCKQLGRVNERDTGSDVFRVEAGASFRIDSSPQTRLLYVLSGDGQADGVPVKKDSAMRIVKGATASTLTARTDLEVLQLWLPRFA